jgi:hypothetical protein
MKRREFLMGAAAVAAAGVARPLRGYAAQQAKQAALDRISIMTLNFQNMLKVIDTQPSDARTLDLFELPQMIADTYGVHKIEFQHYHLGSLEESYLKDLKAALAKSKSTAQQINLEFSDLNMSAPRMRDRLLAIDLTKKFIDHAVTIGAKRVMINQGAQSGQTPVMPTSENKVYSIPALKTMADYGRSKGIIVSVETRGGGGGGNRGRAGAPGAAGAAAAPATPPPAPPAPPPGTPARGVPTWTLLMEIITAAGAYSNVDVGGAAAMNQEELHQCLRIFFPRTANALHTRVSQNWDLATAMRFLEKDLGYKGLYTIEAGGGHQGTKQIYDVVVATLPGLMA